MHMTKAQLIVRNGLRCMGCGRVVEYADIQWHHIKPKYVPPTGTHIRVQF